jgi:hypothetical protein
MKWRRKRRRAFIFQNNLLMLETIALIVPFFIGFILRFRGMNRYIAWFLSGLFMPAFVLFSAFVIPNEDGGVSLWQITIVVSGIYGVIIGGAGVACASGILNFLNRDK